jgi:hypothetical protein
MPTPEGWDVNYQYTAALIAVVCIVGLIFFLTTSVIAWRSREGLSDQYVKVAVVTLVVVVATSVSVSGFGEKTTNSVLGLIGTIVGYLLGRTDSGGSKGGG